MDKNTQEIESFLLHEEFFCYSSSHAVVIQQQISTIKSMEKSKQKTKDNKEQTGNKLI